MVSLGVDEKEPLIPVAVMLLQALKAAVVEEAQPAVSEEVQQKIIDLPSCKDNENLLRIRHSVSWPHWCQVRLIA